MVLRGGKNQQLSLDKDDYLQGDVWRQLARLNGHGVAQRPGFSFRPAEFNSLSSLSEARCCIVGNTWL